MKRRLPMSGLGKPCIGSRKCLNCSEEYIPDYRHRHNQEYCLKPSCRCASKRRSQEKWLLSDKGKGYFTGPDHVRRVQEWREAHPGYWRRKDRKPKDALQEMVPLEHVVNKEDEKNSRLAALQDVSAMQPALLIGLIASLTGSTLQDEIVETSRRFILSGRDILGIPPDHKPKGGGSPYGGKTSSLSGSSSSSTQPVQLGGP